MSIPSITNNKKNPNASYLNKFVTRDLKAKKTEPITVQLPKKFNTNHRFPHMFLDDPTTKKPQSKAPNTRYRGVLLAQEDTINRSGDYVGGKFYYNDFGSVASDKEKTVTGTQQKYFRYKDEFIGGISDIKQKWLLIVVADGTSLTDIENAVKQHHKTPSMLCMVITKTEYQQLYQAKNGTDGWDRVKGRFPVGNAVENAAYEIDPSGNRFTKVAQQVVTPSGGELGDVLGLVRPHSTVVTPPSTPPVVPPAVPTPTNRSGDYVGGKFYYNYFGSVVSDAEKTVTSTQQKYFRYKDEFIGGISDIKQKWLLIVVADGTSLTDIENAVKQNHKDSSMLCMVITKTEYQQFYQAKNGTDGWDTVKARFPGEKTVETTGYEIDPSENIFSKVDSSPSGEIAVIIPKTDRAKVPLAPPVTPPPVTTRQPLPPPHDPEGDFVNGVFYYKDNGVPKSVAVTKTHSGKSSLSYIDAYKFALLHISKPWRLIIWPNRPVNIDHFDPDILLARAGVLNVVMNISQYNNLQRVFTNDGRLAKFTTLVNVINGVQSFDINKPSNSFSFRRSKVQRPTPNLRRRVVRARICSRVEQCLDKGNAFALMGLRETKKGVAGCRGAVKYVRMGIAFQRKSREFLAKNPRLKTQLHNKISTLSANLRSLNFAISRINPRCEVK